MKMIKVFSVVCILSFIAGNAFAVVDLSAASNAVTFATELTPGPATPISNAANALDATAPLGFSIAAANSKYVRFDLNNSALFGAVPTFAINASGGGPADSIVLSSGGNGNAFVIFEVGDTSEGILPAEVGTLACATYTAANSNSVTMSYGLYDSAGEAVNQLNALSTQSTGFLAYSTGVLITEDTVVAGMIDVTNASLQFVAPLNGDQFLSRIGDINALVDTMVRDPADGAVLGAGDIGQFFGANAAITISGDFTALQNDDTTYTGAALNRLYIDEDGGCNDVDTAATSINGTTAVIHIGQNEIADNAEICFKAEGTPEIQETTFTAAFDTDGAKTNPSTMTLETFTKNGASDSVNFLLKSTSAFANLVRITNSGSVAGDITQIKLINDAGDSEVFPLSALAAYPTSTLAGGASTGYINVTDLYAAAQTVDPTFTDNGAQLRLEVTSTCTFIVVNAFAMSKDSNVFTVIDSVDDTN